MLSGQPNRIWVASKLPVAAYKATNPDPSKAKSEVQYEDPSADHVTAQNGNSAQAIITPERLGTPCLSISPTKRSVPKTALRDSKPNLRRVSPPAMCQTGPSQCGGSCGNRRGARGDSAGEVSNQDDETSRLKDWANSGQSVTRLQHGPRFEQAYPLKLQALWKLIFYRHIAHVTQKVVKVVLLRGKQGILQSPVPIHQSSSPNRRTRSPAPEAPPKPAKEKGWEPGDFKRRTPMSRASTRHGVLSAECKKACHREGKCLGLHSLLGNGHDSLKKETHLPEVSREAFQSEACEPKGTDLVASRADVGQFST